MSMNESMAQEFMERVKRRSLNETLSTLENVVMRGEEIAVVFTNGISRYGFLRLLALKLLGCLDYDWRRKHGVATSNEKRHVEERIAEYLGMESFAHVVTVTDARWERSIAHSVAREMRDAGVILVVNRQRQEEINVLLNAVEDGATAQRLIATLEVLSDMHGEEPRDKIICDEYQGLDIVARSLMQPAVLERLASKLTSPTLCEFVHQLIGLPPSVSFGELSRSLCESKG